MTRVFVLTSLFAAAVALAGPPDGFTSMFNGKDHAGWEGSPIYWKVENDPKAEQGKPSQVFTTTKIWNVQLTLSQKEFETIQPRGGMPMPAFGVPQPPKPPEKPAEPSSQVHRNTFGMDLPWGKGSMTMENIAFQDIGIRYKGNGTIIDASGTIRKSFKIELDHFGQTARFHGMKAINLHSGVADPSRCRESLGYALYRAAGVPASQTALAEVRLTVPGKYDKELLGVYTVVEPVNNSFLKARFGTDAGLLMKPEVNIAKGLDGGLREFQYQGDDWERYKKQFAPKRDATKEETKRIIAFAKLIQKAEDKEFRSEIASYLDIEAYLRFLAATSFVSNMDSFFTFGHNFLLYLHPKTGKFHFIPWDLDRAFANLPLFGSNDQIMDLSFVHPYGGTHRLTERLLAIPEVSEQYQKLLKDLSVTCFARAAVLKQLEAIEAATKDLLTHEANAAKARKDGQGTSGPPQAWPKPPALNVFVERRTDSLAAQLTGKSKGFVPSGGFGFGGGEFKIGTFLAGPMLKELDTDKDGMLSRDEWIAWPKKVFAASEQDAQGRVTEKALADGMNKLSAKPPQVKPGEIRPAPGPGGFMAGHLVKRADVNKTGKVTLDELVAATAKLFDDFDKGNAGKLDVTSFGELLTELFPLPNFGLPPNPPDAAKTDKKKG